MAWFLSVLTIVGVVAAPLLVLLFAPGFRADGDRFDLTVDMLRWTFPYILFVSLAALAGGVLNSYGKFAVPATTSTLMNVVMIVFAAFIAPHFAQPGIALAIGVFVSGLVQLGFQLPFMLKLGLLRRPRWNWGHEGVRKIGRLMLPAIFGSSVAQVSLLLDTLIASFLATGSIAWLYYADRLVEFPLGVFSIALATVILPGLAAHHAAQSPERFASTLDWAVKLTTIVVLPATVALLLLAGPLTVVIFHYGKFDEQDVRMSTLALMAYSVGLMGFSMVKVLAPGYFARQDTSTPVGSACSRWCSAWASTSSWCCRWRSCTRTGPACMRCWRSTPASAPGSTPRCCTAACAGSDVLRHSSGWRRTLWQVLAGNVAMGAFLWFVAGDTQRWLDMGAWHRVGWMGVLVIGGAGIYFGVLYVLGMRLRHLRHQQIAMLPRPADTAPPEQSAVPDRTGARPAQPAAAASRLRRDHRQLRRRAPRPPAHAAAVRRQGRRAWPAGDRRHLRADAARVLRGRCGAGAPDAPAREARGAGALRHRPRRAAAFRRAHAQFQRGRLRAVAAGRGARRPPHRGRPRLPLRAPARGQHRSLRAAGERHGFTVEESASSWSTASASAARWCAPRWAATIWSARRGCWAGPTA